MTAFNDHPKWSHEEFTGYLLLYAAYSDMEFSEDERAVIRNYIDENQLKEIEDEYLRLSDIERIHTIEAYKEKYYSTEAEKEELFQLLTSFFKVDGQFSIMEKNLMRMLHKIL